MMVDQLKRRIQKETFELNTNLLDPNGADLNPTCAAQELPKENIEGVQHNVDGDHPCDSSSSTPVVEEEVVGDENNEVADHHNLETQSCTFPSSTPGLILLELKQAKLNLTRTTSDLADIRASVEFFSKKIEEERVSFEKTRERLAKNTAKVSSLEEELNQTAQNLQLAKSAETCDNPTAFSRELQRLNCEAEQFKKMGEAARKEVLRAMSDIEQTKTRIRTVEIRLIAAKKMKEAARAAEAVALADIEALSRWEVSSKEPSRKPEMVTLSSEEYSLLTCKVRDAEELSEKRASDAMVQVDEANVSNKEILKRVEQATQEVKRTRKALEEALNRVEAANRGKLAVEEALRRWRSDHGQKRRSSHNSTKFKNSSYPAHYRRESHLRDINGLNLVSDGPTPVLKPTLSIGQILSRKLLTEDCEIGMLPERNNLKRKVSLGQMLNKHSGNTEREGGRKYFSAKRKKFGFTRISLLIIKQSKKKSSRDLK